MNDDWRLRIDLQQPSLAHQLSELLNAVEIEHDLERSFRERVVVSVDGPEVFCYAGTRAQAEAAEQLIRQLAGEHGWELDVALTHWHPVAEQWESPDEPLPSSEADAAHERAERVAAERSESAEQGYPEFEVRIRCASRGEAGELSERLEQEAIPNVHRWSYVLVGVADEDGGAQLAERLRGELPAGVQVAVERNRRAVWEDMPGNPFAVLGGLAG
ncbi:MAG: hypothetical protein ACR2IP_02670 [Solirubrobacteraceae bacterium]